MINSHKTPRVGNARELKLEAHPNRACYPFSAIVGQDEMKLALILNVIDAKVGGVLIMGHRGTGKSTAVRALADLLLEISVVSGCAYRCDPADEQNACGECREAIGAGGAGSKLRREKSPVRVVELPLGATEDRVCGTIDIEQALRSGVKRFEPGLLARANRGFLYIDEVNLLEDHLVDLLLDVSSTGINNVEREGISVRHPARFVLIGSGNPEEGELRPQLLDRFGLYVEVTTEDDLDRRMEIVEHREAFERDRESFRLGFADSQEQLRRKITRARKNFGNVKVERRVLRDIARLCSELKVDGHRGELTITRAARALAAFEGRKKVIEADVRRVAVMALRHRLRRDALEETASAERIEQTMNKVFGEGRGVGAREGEGDGDDSPSDTGQNGRQTEGKRAAPGSPASKNSAASQNGNPKGNPEAEPAGNLGADATPESLSASSREAGVNLGLDKSPTRALSESRSRFQSSRQPGTNRSVYNQERGRYARSVASPVTSAKASGRVALDATLRAAAVTARERAGPATDTRNPAPDTWNQIPHDALRFKLFKRKQGRLFIFAIDLSGSMALNRITHAREVMLGLLRQSYIHRDRVAIVGFRGMTAELMLPPSKSILRARRVLDTLPMGGGTPLSAGLARALELANRVGPTLGGIVLLVFTDGGANVPLQTSEIRDRAGRRKRIEDEVKRLGSEMRKAGIDPVVVDTQNAFTPNGDALALAENLGARYVQVRRMPRSGSFD